ncbi:MAG: phospho-N-acetylmuramoyl-pentapeptide-transferase, partial [Rhizobiales bacterium]|nr:phospho-N-acetylmuramoyl-pentapeptide-transferase [Hyphomicrobiales bacterium]
MLVWLAAEFTDTFSVLNLFRYITARTGAATITAMLVVFLCGPWIISHLKVRQGRGQPIREDGPERHIIEKQGTPTMGGLMILLGICGAVLLWGDLSNGYVWLVLFVTLAYGLVGFYDDFLKVSK